MTVSYPEARLRVRMSSSDAHYAGNLVAGAKILSLIFYIEKSCKLLTWNNKRGENAKMKFKGLTPQTSVGVQTNYCLFNLSE